MKIIWATQSLRSLQDIYNSIADESEQNALQLVNEITNKVSALRNNPERYNPDKYKKENAGNYRAFEHKKIRISYKVETGTIRIVRVRHTKQQPLKY